MKFGTNLFYEQQLGYANSLKMASKAGFKYVDFDATEHNDCKINEEEKVYGEFKRITDGEGMRIVQTHAPYCKGISSDPTQFTCREFSERVRNSIRRSAMLGAKYVVVHPFIPYAPDYENIPYDYSVFRADNVKRTIDVYGALKDDLKNYNIKLAIENCYSHDFVRRMVASSACSTSSECNEIIDALGDENYCICLDAGHLNLLSGESLHDFIHSLKSRIQVLHLHDNFGALNDWFGELDRHLLPFMGCLNWEELRDSLKEVDYKGVISFEFCNYGPLDFTEELYKYVFKAANLIWNK